MQRYAYRLGTSQVPHAQLEDVRSEATAKFQKLLVHRGILLNEPIGALAYLQLGRAYAMQGNTANARAAHQDFQTLLDAEASQDGVREVVEVICETAASLLR